MSAQIDAKKKKDKWDKFQILAQALIGIAVAAFTGVFGWHQHKNANATLELARSNCEIARAQVQVALLPALASEDPRKRAMALHLARVVDEDFASEVAPMLAVRDSSEIVQRSAKLTLENLTSSQQPKVKRIAKKGLYQYELMRDVKARGLQEELISARNYIEGGTVDGPEKAINIYCGVLNQLPYETLQKLDQGLLRSAQEDGRHGYFDSAARKYRALFPEAIY